MTGLCGACGDQMHTKPCERPGCECKQGVRTDMFACILLSQISRQLKSIDELLRKNAPSEQSRIIT